MFKIGDIVTDKAAPNIAYYKVIDVVENGKRVNVEVTKLPKNIKSCVAIGDILEGNFASIFCLARQPREGHPLTSIFK